MGYFYRPTGGDAGNVPTYPTAPLTVAADASGTSFVLTNSGTTPASVELSFASDTGSASLLIGSNYDQGTDRSPTYVVDPDIGTRTVNLIRGSLSPSDPSSSETVTLTSNTGVLPQTISCTVFKQTFFEDIVRTIATPTYESLFESVANTGSLTFNYTASNLTLNSSSEASGFTGYGEVTGSSGNLTAPSSNTDTWDKTSGTTRTWILAWTNTGSLNGLIVNTDQATGANRGVTGQLGTRTAGMKTNNNGGSIDFDTTHYHCASDGTTTTGPNTSENLERTAIDMNVFAASWNGVDTVRYRWKQSGHGSGFSFADQANPARGSTNLAFKIVGGTNSGNIKYRYVGVIDSDITHSQFLNLLSAAGL